jgi:predicted transposase YbfD/YdcC
VPPSVARQRSIHFQALSAPLSPERFNEVARAHWGVENRLHWRLDVIMNEDQDRSRLGNGPHNLAVLRHMALNVMQKDGEKGSLRGKIKRAGWDEAYLTKLLTLF